MYNFIAKNSKIIPSEMINYMFTFKYDLSEGVRLSDIEVYALNKDGSNLGQSLVVSSLKNLDKVVSSKISKEAAYWANFYKCQHEVFVEKHNDEVETLNRLSM